MPLVGNTLSGSGAPAAVGRTPDLGAAMVRTTASGVPSGYADVPNPPTPPAAPVEYGGSVQTNTRTPGGMVDRGHAVGAAANDAVMAQQQAQQQYQKYQQSPQHQYVSSMQQLGNMLGASYTGQMNNVAGQFNYDAGLAGTNFQKQLDFLNRGYGIDKGQLANQQAGINTDLGYAKEGLQFIPQWRDLYARQLANQMSGFGIDESGLRDRRGISERDLRSDAMVRGAAFFPGLGRSVNDLNRDFRRGLGQLNVNRTDAGLGNESKLLSLKEREKDQYHQIANIQNQAAGTNLAGQQLALGYDQNKYGIQSQFDQIMNQANQAAASGNGAAYQQLLGQIAAMSGVTPEQATAIVAGAQTASNPITAGFGSIMAMGRNKR